MLVPLGREELVFCHSARPKVFSSNDILTIKNTVRPNGNLNNYQVYHVIKQ